MAGGGISSEVVWSFPSGRPGMGSFATSVRKNTDRGFAVFNSMAVDTRGASAGSGSAPRHHHPGGCESTAWHRGGLLARTNAESEWDLCLCHGTRWERPLEDGFRDATGWTKGRLCQIRAKERGGGKHLTGAGVHPIRTRAMSTRRRLSVSRAARHLARAVLYRQHGRRRLGAGSGLGRCGHRSRPGP